MTQEERKVLLKDLCARLPYGVKFPYHIDEDSNHRECDCVATMDMISEDTVEFTYYNKNGTIRDWSCGIREVKPYLRPMSSMTEEEKEEFHKECEKDYKIAVNEANNLYKSKFDEYTPLLSSYHKNDWLNAHHFDYRGLIEKGLAFEAPEGMYKNK